jgi:hypothetical protein
MKTDCFYQCKSKTGVWQDSVRNKCMAFLLSLRAFHAGGLIKG